MREKVNTMKESVDKKSNSAAESAVRKEKAKEQKAHAEIYKAMHSQVPTKIRSVIRTAISSFQSGNVAKADVEKILKKSFSNKTFQQVLLCAQGDLAKCEEVDLEKWRKESEKAVREMAKKAEVKAKKARAKEKVKALKQVGGIVAGQRKLSAKQKKTEKGIQARARKLTQEVMNSTQLNPYEKMETIRQVREQARDIVSELRGAGKEEKPDMTLDFLADQNGNTLKVKS